MCVFCIFVYLYMYIVYWDFMMLLPKQRKRGARRI